ncbi:MAG: RAMP superfamily CRISPR-associated protein [bacterium]
MHYWRFRIRPLSLQITPWQADTIFGSLCWALRHLEGEASLKKFLEPFREGEPSFLISEAFPRGYLPLPFYLRVQRVEVQNQREYQRFKLVKKVNLLPEGEFAKACRGEAVQVDETALSLYQPYSRLHASINRATGTTTAAEEDTGGNLYQLHGHVMNPRDTEIAVYVADRTGESLELVQRLFRSLELTGFGRKKSSGAGAFRLVGDPEPWKPPQVQNGNGFVTLSGFVPRRQDPAVGYWQLRVKHGKLGETYATGGKSPFKKPWILLESGSCFQTGNTGEVYGRMLTDLSNAYPEVVQYAYAFPVPISFPDKIWEAAS